MKKSPNNANTLSVDGITPAIAGQSRMRRKVMEATARQVVKNAKRRNDISPNLMLVKRNIDDLKGAKRRCRKDDLAQVTRIESSLRAFGVCLPIPITKEGEIVSGHLVVEAGRRMGLKEIYCVMIDHLSPVEVRKLRLSLNRLAETGSWDYPELRLEMQELATESEFDFEIPGFETSELDIILQDGDVSATEQEAIEHVPEPPARAVTRLGDVWRCGNHLIACCNATDGSFVLRFVPASSIRLCLTDPPYGVFIKGHVTGGSHREFVEGGGDTTKEELYNLFLQGFTVIRSVLVNGGLCLSFIDWRGVEIMLRAGGTVGWNLINLVVWAKSNAGQGSLYRSGHELATLYKNGTASHVNNIKLGKSGRYRTNVWNYPGASSFGSDAREGLKVHPTCKPVAMLEDAILDLTNRGDQVFDPFAGSGSTLIACHRSGRIFRGCELDPLYVDVILQRWFELTGEMPVLAETNEAFDDVATRREEAGT